MPTLEPETVGPEGELRATISQQAGDDNICVVSFVR